MALDLTTQNLLQEGLQSLPLQIDSRVLDAELLLAHSLGTERSRIRSHPETTRTAQEREHYLALIARRARGEPLAYILGRREFWSLELEVDPAVLVPRPETELLVERALALRTQPTGRVADLGTGSGAVALALARERPGWQVVGIDVSAQALRVARRNAARLGLSHVELIEGSWFAPLDGRRFDLILSNPPYVAQADPVLAAAPLSFEPRDALTPGADALSSIRQLVREAPDYLERDGWLLLEHGATQGAAVAGLLVARGFTHVRSHRDLAGEVRMTEARWG